MQKNGTSDAQIRKRGPLFVANYPQNWWFRLLFHMNIIFGRAFDRRGLGTGQATKTDEFSGKFQTAFDPPSFSEN